MVISNIRDEKHHHALVLASTTRALLVSAKQDPHIEKSQETILKKKTLRALDGHRRSQPLPFFLSRQDASSSSSTPKTGEKDPSKKDADYFFGFERSTVFEQLFQRLNALEKWKELAIRPSSLESCDPEDLDLFEKEVDDVAELQERCNQVRIRMNKNLPPNQVIEECDPCLVTKESLIEGAGMGLFFEPPTQSIIHPRRDVIPKGTIICYYTGHIHNFHSSRELKSDKTYLMMVQGETFVDASLCMHVKARYINDPLNDSAVNCKFVPQECRAAVVATRDLFPGEELFASYGEYYWRDRQENSPGKRYDPEVFTKDCSSSC